MFSAVTRARGWVQARSLVSIAVVVPYTVFVCQFLRARLGKGKEVFSFANFRIVNPRRRERQKDDNVVNNPGHIVRNGRRAATAWSAVPPVGNQIIEPQ